MQHLQDSRHPIDLWRPSGSHQRMRCLLPATQSSVRPTATSTIADINSLASSLCAVALCPPSTFSLSSPVQRYPPLGYASSFDPEPESAQPLRSLANCSLVVLFNTPPPHQTPGAEALYSEGGTAAYTLYVGSFPALHTCLRFVPLVSPPPPNSPAAPYSPRGSGVFCSLTLLRCSPLSTSLR